jgi:hypothetical protein
MRLLFKLLSFRRIGNFFVWPSKENNEFPSKILSICSGYNSFNLFIRQIENIRIYALKIEPMQGPSIS